MHLRDQMFTKEESKDRRAKAQPLDLKEKESLSVPAYVSYLHINFIEEQTEMK